MKNFFLETKDLIIDPGKHVPKNLSFENPNSNTGAVNKDSRVKDNEILVNGEVFRFIKGKFCLFVFKEHDDWGMKFFIEPIKNKTYSLQKVKDIFKIHNILYKNSLSVPTGEIISCSTKKGEISGYGITMKIVWPEKKELNAEENQLYIKKIREVCQKYKISRAGSVNNFVKEAKKFKNRVGFSCIDVDPRCSIRE